MYIPLWSPPAVEIGMKGLANMSMQTSTVQLDEHRSEMRARQLGVQHSTAYRAFGLTITHTHICGSLNRVK